MKYIWTTQSYRPQVKAQYALEAQTAVLERVETTAGEIKKKSIAELTTDLSQLIDKPVMEWAFEAEDKPDCTYGIYMREMTQD